MSHKPEPHNRLYDSVRWRSARKTFLFAHPLCQMCTRENKVTPSTTVHHKIAHKGDYEKFWAVDNWEAVCAPCHSGWLRVQENTGTLPGCDVNGLPLDPRHLWSQK